MTNRGTRPTGPRRWPTHAESIRQQTYDAAKDATELLAEARQNMQRNPYLARELLADVATALERIQRLMIEAKVGAE